MSYDTEDDEGYDDRDYAAYEVTCGSCGREHIPDEDDPTQGDTCYECQNGMSPGVMD